MAAKQAVHERNRAGHNATNVMRELESRMAGVARAAFHPARAHKHTLLIVCTIHAYTLMVVYTIHTHAHAHAHAPHTHHARTTHAPHTHHTRTAHAPHAVHRGLQHTAAEVVVP